MDDFLAARSQMAVTLGFHIVFASIGIAMPFFMATAHGRYLKTQDPLYKTLTQAWSKGVAIFFAVGAVSGTALSFELGLLWPKFMEYAGPIVGMPFSWEGTAFFLEAIALGIFLYGWERVPPRIHWISGLVVGIAGVASGLFVICANGWMNSPAGFNWNHGHPTDINPWAAMFNAAALWQGIHMIVGAFEAVGFAVAGLHAVLWLKTRMRLHQIALRIALVFAATSALVQPLVGDLSAKSVARRQPIKLAAMEGHFETQRHAPLLLGGIPDEAKGETRYALRLPGLLSFLAYGDFNAEVKGLRDFPRDQWPPVTVTHWAFQVMILCGSFLAGLGLLAFFAFWRSPKILDKEWFLRLLMASTPFGFVALEAGWVVTEVGRQPWIIYGLLRTREALTARPGVFYNFITFSGLYLLLAAVVVFLMQRQVRALHAKLRGRS